MRLPEWADPQSAWAAPVKNLMQYIPLPDLGPDFVTSAYPDTLRDDKWSGRIDANTAAGMISGYYFWDNYNHLNPNTSGNVPGFSFSTVGRAQNFNLGDTKSFGPTSINEFRVNYVRNSFTTDKPVGGVGPTLSSQGFTGIVPGGVRGVEPVGFNTFSIGINTGYSAQTNNTYQVLDNFSKVVGTHTLKFGANYNYNQIETLVPGLQSRVFPGAPTGWVFPGDPGIPPTLAPTRYNNFAPRIGLAYAPNASGGLLQ